MSKLNSTYQLSASDLFRVRTEDFLNTRAHVYTIYPAQNLLPGLSGDTFDTIEIHSGDWVGVVEHAHSTDPTDMFEVLVSAIDNQYNISEPSAYIPNQEEPEYVAADSYYWGKRGTHVSYLSVSSPQVVSAQDDSVFSVMLQWDSPISGFSYDTTSTDYYLPVSSITTKSLGLSDSTYAMLCPSGFFKEAIWTVEVRSPSGDEVSSVKFTYDSSISGSFYIECLTGFYDESDFVSTVVQTIETSAMSSVYDSVDSIVLSASKFYSMRISADSDSPDVLRSLSAWLGSVDMSAPSAFSTAGMTYDFSSNEDLKNHMDMFVYAPAMNSDPNVDPELYASTLVVSATPRTHIDVNRITNDGLSSVLVSSFDIPSDKLTTIKTELGAKRFSVSYLREDPIISVPVETKLVPAWGFSSLSSENWAEPMSTTSGEIFVTNLLAYPMIEGCVVDSGPNVLTASNARGARCIIGGLEGGEEYGDAVEKGIVSGSLVPLWSAASGFKKMTITATVSAGSYIDNADNAMMFDLSSPALGVDLTTELPFYVLGNDTFELRQIEPVSTSATSGFSGSVFSYRPSFTFDRFLEDTVTIEDEAVAAGTYSVRAYGKVISISATNPVSAQTLDTGSEDPISALAASSEYMFDGGKDIQFLSTSRATTISAWTPMSAVYPDVDPLSVWSAVENLYQYYVPEFITLSTTSLDTIGPTAVWSVSALTDAQHIGIGLLDNHYIRWYVEASPISAVSSVSLVSQTGESYEIGGLGGHEITVNVVPIQVSGDTSRVSIFLTAVLACKNSDADPRIVDQPVSDQDSISFYTYPSTYVMDFGCDHKKPVEGNVVWSETSTPALNGSFVIGGAVSARYEIGYEDLDGSYQTLTSVDCPSVASAEFYDFVPSAIPVEGETTQTYVLNVTADPTGGTSARAWNYEPRLFTTSIVNNVLSSGDLTASPICVVPTYVFTSDDKWNKNTIGELTPTFPEDRPSAYALQHTEPFLAWSVGDTTGKNIGWYLERDGVISEIINPENGVTGVEIPVRGETPSGGIRVISKSERIVGTYRPMKDIPFRVYGLDGTSGWVLSAYSCYAYTDDSNSEASARNIMMVNPGYISGFSINVDPDDFVVPDRVVLTATMIHEGSYSPFTVLKQVNKWTLSNSSLWNLYSSSLSTDPVYMEIRSGLYESTPGYLFYGDSSKLSLSALVNLSYTIFASGDDGGGWSCSDWGTESMSIPVLFDEILSASVRPRLDFVPKNSTASIGEDIVISNKTAPGYYLGGYRLSDGAGVDVLIPASADSYTISGGYSAVGTYSFSVTGYVSDQVDSEVVTSDFTDLIRIYDFEPYTTEVERVYGYSVLNLPYADNEVGIGPNEWVTAENVNRCFKRIWKNMEYVDKMTTFYHESPTEYSGYVGSYLEGSRFQFGYVDKNRSNVNVNQEDSLSGIASVPSVIESVVSDVVADCLYLVADGKVYVVDKKPENSILHVIDYSLMNENVTRLKSIAIDSFGDIYVIAPETHKIVVFNKYDRTSTTPCRYITEWGGYGGATAKLKFRNPSDLAIDSDDNVWVADTGNKAVKKYTRSGSWLLTILMPDYLGNTDKTGVIGLDVDIAGNVHVLTPKFVYVYSTNGDLLFVYSIEDGIDVPKFIRKMSGAPYMYVGFSTYCKKVNLSGGVVAEFGSDLPYHDFRGCYHDSYRNLYVANSKNLLVYCDGILVSRVSNDSYKKFMWDMDDILINRDENVQDWVLNIAFHRLYDNIDLLRMSLFGKVEYREIDGVEKLVAVDYHPDEYAQLKFEPKSDIFIGTNELVTMSVINRCVLKLQNCLRILLEHI